MKNGLLIVLSAPSGAGKSTLAKELIARDPRLGFSVSATTRPPRTGEVHGRDYYFITEPEFQTRVAANEFLEWARVHNNYYGTPVTELHRLWRAGRDVLLDIDVQGGMQLREKGVRGLFIFIAPPSLAALEERLRKRGTDSEEVIRVRLNNARAEMEFQPRYDHVVVNDSVERALGELQTIIATARAALKPARKNK